MPNLKEAIGVRDNIHIVLRGPDGKIKDERKPKPEKKTEVRNAGNQKPV